jgi:hypothetical protein
VVNGGYAVDMHSTPLISGELGKDKWLATEVEVLKLVCYTQKGLAAFLANPAYHQCSENNHVLRDATAWSLEASLPPELLCPEAAQDEPLQVPEAARIVLQSYQEVVAHRPLNELSRDELSGTRYWPKGFCVRGQASHASVHLPHSADRQVPYLHGNLAQKDGQLHEVAARSMLAEGAIMGHTAAVLRQTFPNVLIDSFEAAGGRRWNGHFTYPPVAVQAPTARLPSDRIAALRLPFQALHCAQVGIRVAGGNPLSRRGPMTRGASAAPGQERTQVTEGFMPTARHKDGGDAKGCNSTIVYVAMKHSA